MPKIFISYRRIDSLERTHRIADWLTLKYGARNVFIDVDRLGGGVDFEDVLQASLEAANVLLVIIGDQWLAELNSRIEDRQQGKDYVYLEVVQGLQKNIDLVIPVMINNTPFLEASDLPIEMQELTRRQLARVRANPDFHKDMDIIRQIIDQKFWYERVIRYGLGFLTAVAVLAVIIFGTLFYFREPVISEADAVESAVAFIQTQDALPSVTGTSDLTATIEARLTSDAALSTDAANEAQQAVAPTRNVDLTATFESILAQEVRQRTETAEANALQATSEPQDTASPTPSDTPSPTSTATPSPTETANVRASVAVRSTSRAQMTIDAQALTDEQTTQIAQLTAKAPTNTPQPTASHTATLTITPSATPSPSNTPEPTVTYTPTPNMSATAEALANLTATQEAFATQIFATAQASRILLGRVDIVEDLNVRNRPSTEGTIIGVAEPGDVLQILDQTADETWIEVEMLNGRSGWVSSEFFRVLGLYSESDIDELRTVLRLVLRANDWEPVIHEFDGVPMVLVPAGCFTLGTSQEQVAELNTLSSAGMDVSDEQPIADICVTYPYWIDAFEVSQEQFARLGGIAEAEPGFVGDDLPQDSVTWTEARDFCEMRGGYLPSEVQWEYAARGVDDYLFPWGDVFELDYFNWNRTTDVDETEPVDSYPEGVSWVGAYQMVGNVWEWTLSRHFAYPNPTRNQIFLEDFPDLDDVRSNRVLRGVSYRVGIDKDARSANRLQGNPNWQRDDIGFRCVRNFEGEISFSE